MPSDPYVHLRVASGYSLQYGASHPADLVARAAEHEMDILALTDRDGLYGAVRFAKACTKAGIAPVLGVDLAHVPMGPLDGLEGRNGLEGRRGRTPVRGGATRDPRLPRVVVLARPGGGWGRLCRLVSAAHLDGERSNPVTDPIGVAEHAADGRLVIMLGQDSEFAAAVAADRPELAHRLLDRWRAVVPAGQLVVGVCHHRVGGDGPGSARLAGRMTRIADGAGIPVVLTNDVRMVDRHQAPTVDVLDSARRLVALDRRHIDRRNAEGYLTSGKEMLEAAREVSRFAGRPDDGEKLITVTRSVAIRCQLDPRADLGIGEIHLPELSVLNTAGVPIRGEDAAQRVLAMRCEAGLAMRYGHPDDATRQRLEEELAVIGQLGFASYFLTVADVVDLVRDLGIRCAARGSGAGSLVNHLLRISGIDPMRHGLVMERFLSPLRIALPDIDLDVESARRLEVYDKILETFGGERVACVAMLETYRVRHAVRDVGAALSLPPGEIDAIAKAFPHIRARDARSALRDLPELRNAGLAERRLDLLFELVESLDGLPRHVALHPCGILLSDTTLLDRTPVEASHDGYPMSQFDKDDVEDLGLLKLDVLGIRMQSSMAHALDEIERTERTRIDLDAVPMDDPDTYTMIGNAATLGCFQIESPGQRELVGKFGPADFTDIVIDISLFRPGPVKSDMVTPFLEARQGFRSVNHLHPDLVEHLADTGGVVVFHEQVIKIIATMTGCTLAEADEARRSLGDRESQLEVRTWFSATTRERGYPESVIGKVWEVLEAFASFGFCKAHAAAFALPTYQSAWLKAHHPAHFLAGVLTHDPGMYPKRLIIEEARRMGVVVLGLDVNASAGGYTVERVDTDAGDDEFPEAPWPTEQPTTTDQEPADDEPRSPRPKRLAPGDGLPDGRGWGIRLSLTDVKGISGTEVARIIAGRPYDSLPDFWSRAQVSVPICERLVLAGAFDRLYGIGRAPVLASRHRVTRRDLLLLVADLDADARADARARSRSRGLRRNRRQQRDEIEQRATEAADRPAQVWRADERHTAASGRDPRDLARRQSRATAPAVPQEVQLSFDFHDPDDVPDDVIEAEPEPSEPDHSHLEPTRLPHRMRVSGLPEMTDAERVRAELSILGLDASRHVVDFYKPMLADLGVTFSVDLLQARSRSEVLIAGVKVATQTPPIRSGRRVVFLTVDDTTGPADATFFEDVQGPYAATVFSAWLLVVRGELRRTGPRGVSVRATGAWDLQDLHTRWREEVELTGDRQAATAAVRAVLAAPPPGAAEAAGTKPAGRRTLVHASGFRQSPYSDIKPAGDPAGTPPMKLWHTSQGSSGR
ncbi:DNA polymerase III subunit alpha [Propionibacteriaceae bacterium Y2011]